MVRYIPTWVQRSKYLLKLYKRIYWLSSPNEDETGSRGQTLSQCRPSQEGGASQAVPFLALINMPATERAGTPVPTPHMREWPHGMANKWPSFIQPGQNTTCQNWIEIHVSRFSSRIRPVGNPHPGNAWGTEEPWGPQAWHTVLVASAQCAILMRGIEVLIGTWGSKTHTKQRGGQTHHPEFAFPLPFNLLRTQRGGKSATQAFFSPCQRHSPLERKDCPFFNNRVVNIYAQLPASICPRTTGANFPSITSNMLHNNKIKNTWHEAIFDWPQ